MDREIMAEIKKLSDRVQYLEDQLVKQRRENANLMEELDNTRNSAISSSFVGAVDKKFSEIMQTEEKIQMTVADVSDEAKKQYSKYEQTAQKIEMEVGAVYNEVLIGKDGNPADNPDKYENYKGSLVSYNGSNYRYSEMLGKWEKVDGNSISSSFKQTADGFFLNGDIKINGNAYQDGNIYVTGKGVEKGSALYVCDGDVSDVAGFISYDANGRNDNNEAGERMIISANGGYALKIATYNTGSVGNPNAQNISIGAGMWGGNGEVTDYSGYGYIYIDSPMVFSTYPQAANNPLGGKDVIFQDGCKVDFTDATVTGLYAVFE